MSLFNFRSVQTLRKWPRIIAAALLTVFIASSVVATPVNAVTKLDAMSPDDSALAFVYYKALRTCLDTGKLKNSIGAIGSSNSMSSADAANYEWFYGGPWAPLPPWAPNKGDTNITDVGVYGDQRSGGDGQHNCYDANEGKAFLSKLVSLTGYSSPESFLCDIGFTRQTGVACDTKGGTNDFIAPANKAASLDAWWSSKIGGGTGPGSLAAGEYVLYYASFMEGCSAIAQTGGQFKIKAPGGPGDKKLADASFATNNRDLDPSRTGIRIYSGTTKTCNELMNLINEDSDPAVKAYNAYLAKGGVATDPKTGKPDSTTTCVIEGVGWIVCSVANFLADVTDGIYGLIENILKVPVINTDTSAGTNGVYNAWAIMRSIANIAFAIGFLIIIFSQLTGVGITNYGVKKTLPRLVISAILVNISFWLAAIAVDLSNIVGAGLYEIMNNVRQSMRIEIDSSWSVIIATLLSGQALVVSTVAGAAGALAVVAVASTGVSGILALVFLAVPLVLGAVLAVLIVIFVLVARQALVVILIIASPLAFVALLLPNTEKLFTKWRQMLVSLLLMYPIVSLIFGGAQIAGLAILASAQGADPIPGGIAIITGQLVIVAPFFFIPTMLMKFSGGGIDKIAGDLRAKASSRIAGINKLSRAGAQLTGVRSLGVMRSGRDVPAPLINKRGRETIRSRIRRAGVATGNIAGGIVNQYAGFQDVGKNLDQTLKEDQARMNREQYYDANGQPTPAAYVANNNDPIKTRAFVQDIIARNEAEERQKATAPMKRELAVEAARPGGNTDEWLKKRALSTEHTEMERAVAITELAAQGRDGVLRDLQKHFADTNDQAMMLRFAEAKDAHAAGLSGKAPDLVKGAAKAFEAISAPDLQGYSGGTAKSMLTEFGRLREVYERAKDDKERETALQNYKKAINSFKQSLKQIATDPSGTLKPEIGSALLEQAKEKGLEKVKADIQEDLDRFDEYGSLKKG